MVAAEKLLLSVVLSSPAQFTPPILHEPLPCIAPGQNPIVNAVFPGADIRTAKVYFRSDKYPKFYYVEMKPGAEGFLSRLPKPSPETEQLVYYIEAVDVSFNNTVGTEYAADVVEGCEQEAPGDDVEEPEIVVGATEAGVPALPPGFDPVGIVGTVTVAGVGSLVSSGSGIGTAVAVGGVAAGVGGAVVAVAPEPEPPPPPSPELPEPEPPPPTSSAPPPPSPSPPPPAPTPSPNEPDPEPTPTPPEPPPPPPPSPVTACFDASFPGNSCNMKLTATCSSGPITSYRWVMAAPGSLGGTTNANGPTVNRSFPGCAGETVTVTLNVDDGGGTTDTLTKSVKLPVSLTSRSRSTALTISLDVPPMDGSQRGKVVVNGSRVHTVHNLGPVRLDVDGRRGENTIEALLTSDVGREVIWTFDFSRAPHFVAGSLRAREGAVLSVDERRITFRLMGSPGERIALVFRLSP